MIEFLANNPFIAIAGICCGWPGLLFFGGFYLGRTVQQRGRPRIVWGDVIAAARSSSDARSDVSE